MESKKKKIGLVITIVFLVALVIGATYAYFQAQTGTGAATDIEISANTVDTFSFEVGDPLRFTANQFTFTEGGNNASATTFAKAILTANNKTNNATEHYYLYLNITNNSFTYSKDSTKPELLLQITDKSGNAITDISGLDYKTITNGAGASISGYDVTTKGGLITLFDNKEITTTSTTEEQWNVTLTFINYEFNQADNGGKTFNAKLMIQKNELIAPDVFVKVADAQTTYGKLGNISCGGGNATYNQQYNRIKISSIDNKYTSCTLNYTDSTSKVNLADYIIGLSGTTQGTGQVVNENGYRYEGKNPNNYIWFNNEYWRIIGVFDSASHGVSGKNLVKIIRADVLDGLAWDKSNTNDWTASSLKSLLNGAYYNAQDGTSSGYCYGQSTTATANCDYTKRGIQSGYRGMIANVTWHLGGYSSASATAESFYGYERGTTVYSVIPTSTTGYIGLMYPSDYGYSVLANSCARTTNLSSYNNATCAGQSWLYGKGDEWTLTPRSSSRYLVFNLNTDGILYDNLLANNGVGFLPVLYLDTSVYKMDGDGSLEKPYIVGMG